MQNDLISRSALKQELRKHQIESLIAHNEEKNVFDIIDEMPCAYDVEKVVAKLEEKKELHTEHYNNSIYKYFPDVKQRYEQIQLVIDKIINIVRNGGKE